MDFLFVAIFLLFPAITLVLLQRSGFSVLRVGLPQFVVISLFFFAFLGTLPLYFGWDEYRVSMGVTNKLLVFQVMLYSGFTMVSVVVGSVFAKTVLNRPAILNKFEAVQIPRKETWLLVLLVGFVLVVLYAYLNKIPKIALLVALFESLPESKVARSMMGNDFTGKYHWYSLVIHDLANILTFSFFALYLLVRKKIYFLLFLFAFSISSFTALMATEKGPFAWLLIGLFIVYVLVKSNGRYPIKKLVVFIAILLAFLVLSYIFFMGISDLGKAFLSVFSRAFAGSIQPAYHYLEFFPEHEDFLMGASFPNPGGILPHQPYALTQEVMNWVNPSGIEKGIVGSMPAVFWGEAYANYGLVGVFVVPFVIGFLLYLVDLIVSRLVDTPFKIGFYVWFLIHYKSLSSTGFTGYLIDFYLIVLVLVFVLVISVANKLKIRFKPFYRRSES
ncbi:MAG: oligosaccharide repeat unit polymerase [Hydrogenovibrio sp.]|uniref:oligosaccharide repeat unit polymerase n=1 Tax=Hydrogenovibrio sp. TaxID=2065821 RepID=UPI00286FFDBC|nr:oligosaccharide repeat unit polymerase [Hydrogenovibrio sp.]MDR9498525.1 oligosaccharide repeat unit polymerase [Hydrogenovibrio sp.]MDR9499245.1 oligosaccharide repeat unit polymerase [Hydrogenovibrio sp.]